MLFLSFAIVNRSPAGLAIVVEAGHTHRPAVAWAAPRRPVLITIAHNRRHSHVMPAGELTAMDLRGFTPANRGCIFEIEQLIASVSHHRIVLFVDGSTDVLFLEQTLQGAWHAMPVDSPNAVAGRHWLQVLQASTDRNRTLDGLLSLLCESFGDRAEPRESALTVS